MAPPLIEIDKDLVRELCAAQLTTPEIARICECSEDTLERRFAGLLNEWKQAGVGSVRRKLYKTALSENKGAVTAMIFYLKNYGGMSEQVNLKGNLTVNHEDGAALDSMLEGVEDQQESIQ